MDDRLLVANRVVFVKSSWCLPKDKSHSTCVDALSRSNELVVLLQMGDYGYIFDEGWTLPKNTYLVKYEFETMVECTKQLQEILRMHNIDLFSRHLIPFDPFPFLISGAILVVPESMRVCFLNNRQQYTSSGFDKVSIECDQSLEWDV